MRYLLVLGFICTLYASVSASLENLSELSWLSASSPGTTCPCSSPSTKRIVNGKETKANEFPFMLAMIRTDTGQFFCGASILTPSIAITAAHCTHGRVTPMSVIAGAHDFRKVDQSVQKSQILRVLEHEKYAESSQGLVNDIALLVLFTPLTFNAHVMPVCMPNKKLNNLNQEAKIIGWGKTGLDLPTSPVLLEMVTKISQPNDCKLIFPLFQETSMICSNSLTSTACVGDSGGPMIWLDPEINRYTLVGLVSYGYPPGCILHKPTVMTDVSAYLPWIQARVQGYCQKV